MIQTLVSATTFLAALASALAACFWYRAAQVEVSARHAAGLFRLA